MFGELKKLRIEAYDKIECQGPPLYVFPVMFNPSGYTRKYEVEYDSDQGKGTTGSTQKFGRVKPQDYTFELVFDGTGTCAPKIDVTAEIETFLMVAGKMNGEKHRPHYLKLFWGSLVAKCVLKSADISYNLFNSYGMPLRAKVAASFSEFVDDKLRTAEEGKKSPDLTHSRAVLPGDTLPLMAYRIYGDPSYYLEVARFNALTDFRNLTVGTSIQFPPLKNGKREA